MKSIKNYIDCVYGSLEDKTLFKIDWLFFNQIQDNLVKGITDHSKRVESDFIFIAIKGYKIDSHHFINDLVKTKNNLYIFLDQAHWEDYISLAKDRNILFVGVPDPRKILAYLSAIFYDFPSRKIKLIGVTGTNGKTSITFMLNKILLEAGYKTKLIGTYGIYDNEKYLNASLTTPNSLILQELFYQACQDGTHFVIMEISSHAIHQNRILCCDYDIIIFSSFSRDHLDFHISLENYFSTKMSILKLLKESEKKNKLFIFNADMENYSTRLLEEVKKECLDFKMYSLKNKYLNGNQIDYHVDEILIEYNRVKFSFFSDLKLENKKEVWFSLLGNYNISNALAVSIAIDHLKIPFSILKNILSNIIIPGRYQIFTMPNKKSYVIIDYAHTDDALKNILESILNDIKPTSLITIFGCGGDRDQGKRSLMGKTVSKYSDFAIVTNDNPRNEDPNKIVEEIIVGFLPNFSYIKILDRKEAISYGINRIKNNDVLLIAGKGSETEQIIKDNIIPFSDIDVVKNILEKE